MSAFDDALDAAFWNELALLAKLLKAEPFAMTAASACGWLASAAKALACDAIAASACG